MLRTVEVAPSLIVYLGLLALEELYYTSTKKPVLSKMKVKMQSDEQTRGPDICYDTK